MVVRLVLGLALTLVVVAVSARRAWWLYSLIASGQPDAKRADGLGGRVRAQFVEVFGQRKLLRWSIPGIAHLFTMWGFFPNKVGNSRRRAQVSGVTPRLSGVSCVSEVTAGSGGGVPTALLFGDPGTIAERLATAGFAPHPIASLDAGPLPAETAVAVVGVEGTLAAAVASWARDLRALLPEVPVLVVCAEVRPGETRQALAAGVRGIVLEEGAEESFGPCLAAVLAGAVCVPRRQARQVEPATLSAREKQILGMVVMGYMNGEIAERLFVAESTVKSHLSSAFAKLDVRSRNEAVELILDAERGLGVGILGLESEPIAG